MVGRKEYTVIQSPEALGHGDGLFLQFGVYDEAVLHFNEGIYADALDQAEVIFQQRDRDRQLPQLLIGKIFQPARPLAQAVQCFVMKYNDLAVPGQLYIQLDGVRPVRQSRRKRLQGVFGMQAAEAPVRDSFHTLLTTGRSQGLP